MTMRFLYLCILSLFFSTFFAQINESALRRAEVSGQQTKRSLIRAARNITDAASNEMESVERWEAVRDERRKEMRDMLGLLPFPERSPLRARTVGTLDRGAYRIERLVFESLPKFYVTANLYLPTGHQDPLPAVVYVCGHAYSRFGNKASYQRHGISLAKNGYVAIILDSIQVAETFALHHGVYNQEMYEWYSRGYTPAGVEVWNAMRAIDYLETRPEVDSARIGMTGRSGGAAMTWFTAGVDLRVKVAVPVMGISTYAANLEEDTQRLHCDCMFLINSYRHGMLHQGALIAPRPLLMMHGSQDALFPVAGYEEFEQRVGRLYESYGKLNAFKNIVVDSKHEDSEFLREQALLWFDRYLKEIPERKLDLGVEEVPHESLAVFPDGPPQDSLNHLVHETIIKTPQFEKYESLAEWAAHRQELMGKLRNKVFGAFPPSRESPVVQRGERTGSYFEKISFEAEPGVDIHSLLHVPETIEEPVPGVLYVASESEDSRSIQQLFAQSRNPDNVVRLVVYPRGIGEVSWNKSLWKSILRNAMHVGHTVDSLRLWDVLRASDVIRSLNGVDPQRITVLGIGTSSILGLYAAILDPGIQQVFLINPPTSHLEGPHFLNILRYLDLPEAAALIAPRRLNFYSRMPEAFRPVARIYELSGSPDRIHVSMDIEAVIQGRYDHHFASGR
jgi:cephalosporin-C deacetylase-like acetyl esterase